MADILIRSQASLHPVICILFPEDFDIKSRFFQLGPMLTEYRNVRQESPSLRRRWFEGGDLELIVWQNLRGELTGFQLCHNQAGGPHALTWTPKDGFTHSCVDEGDSSPLRNETPILQPGGTVPWARLAEKFAAESGTIEPALRDAVANRLYTQG